MTIKTTSCFPARLLITLVFLCTAATASEPHAESPMLSLPFLSDQISGLYAITPQTADIRLLPKYRAHVFRFDAREAAMPIKGDHFGRNTVDTDTAYYEVGHFVTGRHTYRLRVYESLGESDTPLLNTLLCSYDLRGAPTDALLLDSRFSYEDIQRYSDFIIDADALHIDGYVIRTHEIVNGGDIGRKLEPPSTALYFIEDYRIEDGHFILSSRIKGHEGEDAN